MPTVELNPLKMRFCRNCRNYSAIIMNPKCTKFNVVLTIEDLAVRAKTCAEYSNKYESGKT